MSYTIYYYSKNFDNNYGFGNFDYLSNILYLYFSTYFGFILGFNILAIIFLTLNLYITYKLFNKLSTSKIITILFTIIYGFSVFYLYRVQSLTVNLLPIFIFPFFLYLLYTNTKATIIGFILGIFSILSSYFMFFSGILISLWYIYFKQFKNFFNFVTSFLVVLFLLNFQIILANNPFIKSDGASLEKSKPNTVFRPIEDWYNFSIKPWYLFIPPKNSTYLGDFSGQLHQRISDSGYYLAQNYVEDEMAGTFLGWHFILGLIFVTLFLFIKPLNTKLKNYFEGLVYHQKLIYFSLFSILSISLISLPPSFTISGIEFFTPSYLLYKIVPFFRVLSRFGTVLFLLTLVINLILVSDISKLFKNIYLKIIFYTSFALINFFMFSINLNMVDTNNPPIDIIKLADISKKNYLAIPTDFYSIFWGSQIKSDLYSLTVKDSSELNILNKFSYLLFSENYYDFKYVDTVIVYKNKIGENNLNEINKLNSKINSISDMIEYLQKNFGNIAYEDASISIFYRR